MLFSLCSCSINFEDIRNNLKSKLASTSSTGSLMSEEVLGYETLEDIVSCVENQDKGKIKSFFAQSVIDKCDLDTSIEELLQFYKGKHTSIDYEFSVESKYINMGDIYVSDECLGFVKTDKGEFSFEFIICKSNNVSNEKNKLWALIVSTPNNRESDKYDRLFWKIFDATYDSLSDKNSGIFIV
jgi:hypothetical protein